VGGQRHAPAILPPWKTAGLLYGTESLTILDKHQNGMQISEMKYLRKVLGKTRRDQIRNTKIRNQLKQESVEVLMEKRTLRW
jgi:hypothetical protein